ncbi:hypothetical protein C8R43DRAFT_852330, partial [Mycena crocata]
KKKKRGRKTHTADSQNLVITRQLRVLEICDLTKLPSCWIPPPRDDGENFVYRLNLENDPGAWLDHNQQPLSMAAMIKSEDQNAWGGGSSGSTPPDKATKVTALDGVFCRVATVIHRLMG